MRGLRDRQLVENHDVSEFHGDKMRGHRPRARAARRTAAIRSGVGAARGDVGVNRAATGVRGSGILAACRSCDGSIASAAGSR